MPVKYLSAIVLILLLSAGWAAENIKEVRFSGETRLEIKGIVSAEGEAITFQKALPLFSLKINDSLVSSKDFRSENSKRFAWNDQISGRTEFVESFGRGWKAHLILRNETNNALGLSDLVPLGQSDDHIYITASGPRSLARSKLFFPERGPVGVILPDNAWELGYSDWRLNDDRGICALARRDRVKGGKSQRWKTVLEPGGQVTYNLYIDMYTGPWQEGLRLMFQERHLYDVNKFDNSMFERPDLQWVRQMYATVLMYAWDHDFYDTHAGRYTYARFLERAKHYLGGWDAFILWPTWPTLGVDQRNQWDLYADLPGGLNKMRAFSGELHEHGTQFFVSYNPWDRSTRYVNPYKGMADLIRKTNADGVVLDTYGHSSDSLQMAADAVRQGVCMYSEGMAVPKDMQGIVSGRVHNAITMPPPLNLNKLIKPEFAIFRVSQLKDHFLHRDLSVSFFNGYGTELNVMSPERPHRWEKIYSYFGKLLKIQRENSENFLSRQWTPLIDTEEDSIWVNRWPGNDKLIYTVFSLKPEGFQGGLFDAEQETNTHWVSLYHHEELKPDTIAERIRIPAKVEGFSQHWLNSRREGNVDCIARLPNRLKIEQHGNKLDVFAKGQGTVRIWQGDPSYQKEAHELPAGRHRLNLYERFKPGQGKFVVQLLQDGRLIDERITHVSYGTPVLVSEPQKTEPVMETPDGMVRIPAGPYVFQQADPDGFLQEPDHSEPQKVVMEEFFIDKYPVTNRQYKQFLEASTYQPEDTLNYLKNWQNGTYPEGKADYPVVYVSIEDARAYARWAGKRLPTEREWQYAAQGRDGRKWPWGSQMDSSRCNVGIGSLTAVDAYPSGASPFGVMDLVGNIWQLTADEYDNGAHYFLIMRGGSYYHPTSSWWYVKGGPQPLDQTQMLLRVSPGFERNATVGFRCVIDARKP